MFYYAVAILRQKVGLLTYRYHAYLPPFSMVEVPLGKGIKTGVIIRLADSPRGFDARELAPLGLCYTPMQIRLASFITSYYGASYGESFALLFPYSLDEARMSKADATSSQGKEADAAKGPQSSPSSGADDIVLKKLSSEQASALALTQRLKRSLLFGDTGSGKSEVYFHAIASALWGQGGGLSKMDATNSAKCVQPKIHSTDLKGILSKTDSNNLVLSKIHSTNPVLSKIDSTNSKDIESKIDLANEAPAQSKLDSTNPAKTDLKAPMTQALLLLPEISLTPQMSARLRAAFPHRVAIFHSKVSKKRREEIISGVASGAIEIVAGARSALFLPFKNLGLIIVDEEHDGAYKAISAPRYHARDLCIYLSVKYDIGLILGSATPALKTYLDFKGATYRLRGKYKGAKNRYIFSSRQDFMEAELLPLFTEVLLARKQALVFLPTRANFKIITCDTCHATLKCPFCDVNMSLHLDKGLLMCHYCGYRSQIVHTCPACGGKELISTRMGTMEFARQLESALVRVDALREARPRIAVLDRDSASTLKKLDGILDAFSRGEIDVLVGTQMLSKGHSYDDIALGVVLGLDYIFNTADFRASERAFSTLYQVAGRAGRDASAMVFVHSIYKELIEGMHEDYEEVLAFEALHTSPSFPPYARLLLLTFANKSEAKALGEKDSALALIEANASAIGEYRLISNKKSSIERLYNEHRYELLLSSKTHAPLIAIVTLLRQSATRVMIDMDPINL